MSRYARLLIADSEHHADMLYVSGIFVPDPFIAVEIDGRWHGLLSSLEIDRARKHSRFAAVHQDTLWHQKAGEYGWAPGLAACAGAFIRAHDIRKIIVPGDFPLYFAEQLRQWGFTVSPLEHSMFPERAVKSAWEIRQLARAERLTRNSMQQAYEFLAACSIDEHRFLRHPDYKGRIRASDVRCVIETFLVAQGSMPAHTIVACGRQGADPHNTGSGFIRSEQPIIIDIFPRLLDSGYWGDMTRTFVKGKASAELRRMYQTVRSGQAIGLEMVASGVNARHIHERITQYFEQAGFPTGTRRGRQIGFFHGTGHGVGLDIHEAPRVSRFDQTLQSGHVITIEPGLYYPNIGGIRLEDLVVVTDQGHRNLTRYPCRMEIE